MLILPASPLLGLLLSSPVWGFRRRRRQSPFPQLQLPPKWRSLFQGSRRFTHTSKSCLSPAPGRRSAKLVSLSFTPPLTCTMQTKTSLQNNLLQKCCISKTSTPLEWGSLLYLPPSLLQLQSNVRWAADAAKIVRFAAHQLLARIYSRIPAVLRSYLSNAVVPLKLSC